MKIYGIAGMPLAGKTTVAEILRDEGFATLDMGDVVRIEKEERELDMSEGSFADAMRERHGKDAIARLCVPYFEEVMEEREKIAITGMRAPEEKRRFEQELDESIEMISIWASPETRERRRNERGREDDEEALEERDRRELEYGLGDLVARGDHMIKNEETEQELEEKVKNIVG